MAKYTQFDALQWLAYRVKSVVGWTTDSIAWSSLDNCPGDDHEPELTALGDLIEEMNAVLSLLVGHWGKYSDGRDVVTRVRIEDGHELSHLWSPDLDTDKPKTFTGRLLADPGEDNGKYEVRIIPPQTVEVRVLRLEKGGRS
ncbi:hypothetical protein [Nocardia gipuzkoensis]